jgi:hypothetical protein
MTEPMESPRTTLSLGPLEISIRRGDEGPRYGLPGSVFVHAAIVLLAMLISTHTKREIAKEEEAKAREVPTPITFVSPLPPPPVPAPRPVPQTMDMRKPPAAQAKPLRMAPVPESTAALTKSNANRDAGHSDTKPAGGDQGGPLPRPTAGVPEIQPNPETMRGIEPPKDLQGRLQDFRRALDEPKPTNPKGEKGGGTGRGGVTMPNLPATGYGVGNLEFEGRDYDWEDYGRQIHGIIWRAWHNRLLITSSVFERWASEHRTWLLDHANGVRFTILRSGKVVEVAIETPSGCYPLDDSATDALKEVILPPLPEDFTRESETVHARFIANGEIRGMGVHLQRLKDAGYF